MAVSTAPRTCPPPADYPDPCDPSGETLRFWDGAAWTDVTSPRQSDATPPPAWHRRPLAFLGHHWFHVLLAAVLSVALSYVVFAAFSPPAVVLGLLAAASAVLTALAFGYFVNSRLRLDQVADRPTIVAVFVAGGIVGQAIVQLERLLPQVAVAPWHWSLGLVGPIEEVAKLAVPVALYLLSGASESLRRFRDPRLGLTAVLASAAAFGVAEAFGLVSHAARAAGTHAADVYIALPRPLVDPVIHMLLSGIFGAVAWRAWHDEGRFCLTWRVGGCLLLVMALHDLVDGVVLFGGAAGAIVWIGLLAAVYILFRHVARTSVPPDNVDDVPPRWKPTCPITAEHPDRPHR